MVRSAYLPEAKELASLVAGLRAPLGERGRRPSSLGTPAFCRTAPFVGAAR